MKASEFLEVLEPRPELPLNFIVDGVAVAAGFHVTEIKSAAVHAMDCGGKAASWSEVVLQLLPPDQASDEEQLSVGKFLRIYRRVADTIAVDPNARVRVEYGAAGQSAVSYPVAEAVVSNESVTVELDTPVVACKGADRTLGDIPVLKVHGDVVRNGALVDSARVEEQEAAGCCSTVPRVTAGSACCG